MRVEVTVKFSVEVEGIADDKEDDEFKSSDAIGAADLAVYESLSFVGGNDGYNLHCVESTEVHVDGYGECRVNWLGELFEEEAEIKSSVAEKS